MAFSSVSGLLIFLRKVEIRAEFKNFWSGHGLMRVKHFLCQFDRSDGEQIISLQEQQDLGLGFLKHDVCGQEGRAQA